MFVGTEKKLRGVLPENLTPVSVLFTVRDSEMTCDSRSWESIHLLLPSVVCRIWSKLYETFLWLENVDM
jgi:hypothetical protein